jgi:hypothetical protein
MPNLSKHKIKLATKLTEYLIKKSIKELVTLLQEI